MGITWTKQTLPVEYIYGRDIVFVDDRHSWLLCDDGLLFHTNNNGSLIVGVESKDKLPTNFILEQNYPNPFNPRTTIEYSTHIPTSGVPSQEGNQRGVFVTLKVYDILGNEIATLVNEYQQPGKY